MFTGLSITFMLLGNLIPLATYVVPAISGLFIIPILYEYKTKTAFTFYLSVSILAILFVPDKEIVLMYVLSFGIFSVFKAKIEVKYNKMLKFIIKLLFANTSLVIIYLLLILVFPIPMLVEEFNNSGVLLIISFIIIFDITFLLYDRMITVYTYIYIKKYRKRFFKK